MTGKKGIFKIMSRTKRMINKVKYVIVLKSYDKKIELSYHNELSL